MTTYTPPKIQAWLNEIEENRKVIENCEFAIDNPCPNECPKRAEKIKELEDLIAYERRYLHMYPTQ